MPNTIQPEDVTSVLLVGETEWISVEHIEPAIWRIDDGSGSTSGRRGWRITTIEGEVTHVDSRTIAGVR